MSGDAGPLYDRIGVGYSVHRTTDPRIAGHVWAALGSARSVLNVGAGTGSYEPSDRDVVAIEPSAVMRDQRSAEAAPAVGGIAEALPFRDGSFDAAMAVFSDHHWADPVAGLREMARVAPKVVVVQWDSTGVPDFWLVRDYLPEFRDLGGGATRRSLRERADAIGASMTPIPVPWDCADGFFHAFWRRPEAYLDLQVRAGASVWARLGPEVTERAVGALAADLSTGEWHRRNADLIELDELDVGIRLLVTPDPGSS